MSAQTQYPSQPQKSGRRIGLLSLITFAVAVLALILASGGAVLAWRADARAAKAASDLESLVSRPAGTAPQAAPSAGGAGPASAEPTPDPDGTDGESVPTLSPQTQYAVKYTDEVFTLPPRCNANIAIDLDEPRVQAAESVSEIIYSRGCGDTSPRFNLQQGVEGSEVTSASVTPAECAEKIRTSPLANDTPVPIRRGQVFCIKTSLDNARSSAITWKMVILAVTATAQDDTVGLRSSAWNIPD